MRTLPGTFFYERTETNRHTTTCIRSLSVTSLSLTSLKGTSKVYV